MVVDPLYCCFTLLCPPCAAYFQRERILHNNWSHYFTACMTEMPIFEEIACVIDRIADISYCVVCSCMQTQQMLELDKRDGVIIRPWSNVPPQEQMMSRS
ncbi:unnamed protein product [Sphagnum troendelagicum]